MWKASIWVDKRGMTLIEILVGMAITVTVITLLSTPFINMQNANKSYDNYQVQQNEADFLVHKVQKLYEKADPLSFEFDDCRKKKGVEYCESLKFKTQRKDKKIDVEISTRCGSVSSSFVDKAEKLPCQSECSGNFEMLVKIGDRKYNFPTKKSDKVLRSAAMCFSDQKGPILATLKFQYRSSPEKILNFHRDLVFDRFEQYNTNIIEYHETP